VPKYKFKWTNLPPAVLRALRRDLTIGYDEEANPADALREAYGAIVNTCGSRRHPRWSCRRGVHVRRGFGSPSGYRPGRGVAGAVGTS
jgi:hypothetical protein